MRNGDAQHYAHLRDFGGQYARLKHGWPLAELDRSSFYGGGAHGYIDYPPYQA